MVKVSIIRRKNKATLVQWIDAEGDVRRGTIPADDVHAGDLVEEDTLEMAIPAGFPWGELIGELHATPETIQAALYRVGIWTLEDLEANTSAALGAIQAAYKLDLTTLLAKARQFDKNKGG